MTIVAKFPGRCLACGGAVSAGELVEWKKGEGVTHEHCAKPTASVAPEAQAFAPTKEQAHALELFGSGDSLGIEPPRPVHGVQQGHRDRGPDEDAAHGQLEHGPFAGV